MKHFPAGLPSDELARVCGGVGDPGFGRPLDPPDQPTCPVALPPSLF